MTKEKERAKDFMKCLGNGKDIYQIESEEGILEEITEQEKVKITKFNEHMTKEERQYYGEKFDEER